MDAIHDRELINNSYYDQLADKWYSAHDDPIALLRAETREKLRWALPLLNNAKAQSVLDVGCGGGFATNFLARLDFQVSGIDFSEPTLSVARRMDATKSVNYVQGDAYQLPFVDGQFDAVLAFDFLEHVSDPQKIVQEVARVLKPGGQFLFHTFNRSFLAWLIVIKGVEWFVKNTPKDLHTIKMFIKPEELNHFCSLQGLSVQQWTGLRPKLNKEFWKMLATKEVPEQFEFRQTKSKLISYCGQAIKSMN